jgi:pimeloyl-ACP methyl ester carboxylesterase
MSSRPLPSLLALALLATAAAPASRGPALRLDPAGQVADSTGAWRFPLVAVNEGPVGLYLDSLVAVIEDTGPGVTGLPRTTRLDLTRFAAPVGTLAAGDSVTLQLGLPPLVDEGRLTLHWHARTAAAPAAAGVVVTALRPGPVSQAHPSRLAEVGGRAVELVELPPAAPGAPGLVLVHGHGAQARTLLPLAARMHAAGLGVVLVSQPGYGRSAGPADHAGPASRAAVGAALDALRRLPGVAADRCAVWGVGLGAGLAVQLAGERPDAARAVIAQGGVYDLAPWMAEGPAGQGPRARLVAEAGSTAAAWAERSALAGAGRLRAPVLVVHGRNDDHAPLAQARALADAIRAGGGRADTLFVRGGRQLAPAALEAGVLAFLGRALTR